MVERTAPPVVPRRRVRGVSAVLLPMRPDGTIDWPGWAAHLERTLAAGLVPAVNMDTGFGPSLAPAERARILAETASRTDTFIAGVHLDDRPDDPLDPDRMAAAATEVAESGALPILFPNFGLAAATDDEVVEVHRWLGDRVGKFLAFELAPEFHPAGRLYGDEVFEAILGIDAVVGAKHSSLRRSLDWTRIRIRDRVRPEFWLMTGNDLAIDLVTCGVDYLLGLSTFHPEAFAARDAAWAAGDEARFRELNDLLQALGWFTFRPPIPGYRHDAAMFLCLRGLIDCDATHPEGVRRPASDRDVLADLAARLEAAMRREAR
jgi:dihydrodipicolinate synthase/N-acetylneuraminate lyase